MYLLFAGDSYYPCGGWNDYIGDFPSEDSAMEYLAAHSYDWWHLVASGSIVRSGGRLT